MDYWTHKAHLHIREGYCTNIYCLCKKTFPKEKALGTVGMRARDEHLWQMSTHRSTVEGEGVQWMMLVMQDI